MTRELHVGCSPLTKTIYAGSVGKDGRRWLSNRTDVTLEALFAVAEHIGAGFEITLPSYDGSPGLIISVKAASAQSEEPSP